MSLLVLLILKLAVGEGNHHVSKHLACPTWTHPNKTSLKHECICGDSLKGAVDCDPDTLRIRLAPYYCISYDKLMNTTVIGNCPYRYSGPENLRLSKDPATLDSNFCGGIHRTGQFCGKCKEDYHFPVYSYSRVCIKCDNFQYGWIKFIAAALLPLTFFYILIVVFRISATSPALNGYILVSQLLSAPITLRHIYNVNTTIQDGYPFKSCLLDLIIALYAVWNLDFFRGFYTTLCVHPKLTYRYYQVLMFDYAIALYPLLLILITYIFVKLHDNFQFVVWIWRPFHRCLFYFRKQWNIHSSLVNALATFIILSYIKILNVSFQLLIPSFAFNMEGQRLNKVYLYYDGTIEMASKEYLPYLLVAVFMLLTFNILPLALLALYPCQCFQKVLDKCCFSDHCRLSLNIFMDAFQGCFKNSPRYLRHFATLYLTLRFINPLLFAIFGNLLQLPLCSLLLVFTMALVIKFQPYKSNSSNMVDTIMLFVTVSICQLSVMNELYDISKRRILVSLFLVKLPLSILLIPPSYAVLLVVAKLLPAKCYRKILSKIRGEELLETTNGVPNYHTFQEHVHE